MSEEHKDEKDYFLDKPENVNRLLYVFYVICGILLLLDFVIHRHTKFAIEEIPGFYALFGFIAFCVLVLGSFGLRWLVMRKEDYYDD